MEKGFTQEYIARELGYKDKASISYVENGKKQLPGYKLVKLAELLDLEIEDLVKR